MGKLDGWETAVAGCLTHYFFDITVLEPHERAAIRNAVQAEMDAGGSKESCMMVAAIRLREIYPQVNGVKERA